jgi:tol-pal system protein YbgF
MQKSLMAAASKVCLLLYASFLSSVVAAQDTSSVVESRGFTTGQSSNQVSNQSSQQAPFSNNDGLSLLLDQNQQLQAEVQALRGLVEEQDFEIRKIQRDSLSRYTNTDDRLSSLESGAVANITIPLADNLSTSTNDLPPATITRDRPLTRGALDGVNVTNDVPNQANTNSAALGVPVIRPLPRNSSRGTLQPAVLSEQQLYQMAYDSVINSNFERSIAEFDQYLSIYDGGRFVTNAHYWKGQAYLYLNRYSEAKDSYEIILNQHADSAKLPDAMYGLGLAYQGLGNILQAKQLLNDIKRRFPNTGVANLADTRLLSLD